jgi:hypothetical protein
MSVFRVGSNKSSVNNFPSVRPTLDLDFANSKTLDPRITFTRASGGSYTGADGLIKYAGVNEARFDHDPYTGESLGLLVEEGRTNLLTDSAGNFNYGFNNQIIPTANDVAPDGTTVLCKHDLTGVSSPFLNCRANTTLNAGTYTMSMYLKGTTSFSGSFAFVGETNNEIYVNTANITTTWQRFTLTFTLLATSTLSRLQLFFATQGEGKVVSVWGAQLEAGSFATTYIARSSGAQATRAADNASITGKNFSEWYRPDEGTFITKAKYDGIPISGLANRASFATISTEGTIASWTAWWDSGNYAVYVVENPQNTYQAILTSGLISINQTKKTASAYKLNDFAFTADGASPSLDTSGTVPSNAQLFIGSLNGTAWHLDGTISRLTYFPKRLPNEQLQALTK